MRLAVSAAVLVALLLASGCGGGEQEPLIAQGKTAVVRGELIPDVHLFGDPVQFQRRYPGGGRLPHRDQRPPDDRPGGRHGIELAGGAERDDLLTFSTEDHSSPSSKDRRRTRTNS